MAAVALRLLALFVVASMIGDVRAEDQLNGTLICDDLDAENAESASSENAPDLRPCSQSAIKRIIADATCPEMDIDERRNFMCSVEGGRAKGCRALSGHNKPKKIFRENSMERSSPVSIKELDVGDVWVQYDFRPRAVMVHKFFFSRPTINATTSPTAYQLWGYGRDGVEENKWSFIHRFQVISLYPGQRATHSIPFRRRGHFLKYRLVFTATLWKQYGREVGEVVLGDLQLCYQQLKTHKLREIEEYRIEESSMWSDEWAGKRAFNGTTYMWASALQRLDSFQPQWVSFEYPQPKTISRFSFLGPDESERFGDGPTAYRLEATNDYLEWDTLFETDDGEAFNTDISRRKHDLVWATGAGGVPDTKPYKKYKLLVTRTGWMEKGLERGYVVVRDFLLC